jgi:hypothetical protein
MKGNLIADTMAIMASLDPSWEGWISDRRREDVGTG